MAKNHTSTTSRIFDAVYETALDLHAMGVIDKHKLREYKVLCGKPSSESFSEENRVLRKQTRSAELIPLDTKNNHREL